MLCQAVNLKSPGNASSSNAAAPGTNTLDRVSALDALFEWCTSAAMPDPSVERVRALAGCVQPPADRPVIGRTDLEQELLTLILAGAGDGPRAREIGDLLDRRGSPGQAS
jgi:hypothetical protein